MGDVRGEPVPWGDVSVYSGSSRGHERGLDSGITPRGPWWSRSCIVTGPCPRQVRPWCGLVQNGVVDGLASVGPSSVRSRAVHCQVPVGGQGRGPPLPMRSVLRVGVRASEAGRGRTGRRRVQPSRVVRAPATPLSAKDHHGRPRPRATVSARWWHFQGSSFARVRAMTRLKSLFRGRSRQFLAQSKPLAPHLRRDSSPTVYNETR